MTETGGGGSFSDKHGPEARPAPEIADAIRNKATENSLPCAVAFQIAEALHVPPSEVGKTIDLLDFRLVKCQLGLFGYAPQKKIVKPAPPDDPEMVEAIRSAMQEDRLACRSVWEIAGRFGVRKMTVSGVCEALGVKIKPCQLGAF